MKFYCNSFAWTVYLIVKEFFACCSSVSLSVFLSQEKIVSQTHNTCLTKYFHGIILFWVVPLLELLKIFYYTQLIRYEVTLEDIYWKLLCGEIIYNYLYRNHSNIGNINMYVMHIHLTDITMSAIFMRNLWMKLWRKPLYQNNVFQDCPCLAPSGLFRDHMVAASLASLGCLYRLEFCQTCSILSTCKVFRKILVFSLPEFQVVLSILSACFWTQET